jgi:hypothetical protein
MKLSSIKSMLSNAKIAFFRFPATILSAVIFAFVVIVMIEQDKDFERFSQLNLLLTSLIGISSFFLAQIFFETYFNSWKQRASIYGIVFILLALIYLSLPNAQSQFIHAFPYINYLIYFITAHLMIAIIPFVKEKKYNGFWNYNKLLFIRIIVTQIFSTVLSTGLLLALGAIKMLFDVTLDDKLFPEIYVTVFTIFNTWFFVANIPSDLQALEHQKTYPAGLKIFSQYILLPLLLIYLLILYAYGGKIILSWEWPKGIVSYLILCISVVGGLTFLLLHPYANSSENQWIKNSTRWYYILLMPLLFMLFFAIFLRLGDYGITLNRYVILIFGIWVSIVSVYTIMGKTNIRFIPISLIIILLLSSFGPWSMDNIPKQNQKKRLEVLLTRAGIMKNGKVLSETKWPAENTSLMQREITILNDKKLTDSLQNEVISIVQYLDQFHDCDVLNDWFTQNMDSIVKDARKNKWINYNYDQPELYLNTLGLSSNTRGETESQKSESTFELKNRNENIISVSGYDYAFLFNEYSLTALEGDATRSLIHDVNKTKEIKATDLLIVQKPSPALLLKYKNKEYQLALSPLIEKLKLKANDNNAYEKDDLRLVMETKDFKLVVEFYEIVIQESKNEMKVGRIGGVAYLDEK